MIMKSHIFINEINHRKSYKRITSVRTKLVLYLCLSLAEKVCMEER